jgi:hypothetical protein
MISMMSISPFGHKAVGDVSGGQNVSIHINHTRPSLRLSGNPDFVEVKWCGIDKLPQKERRKGGGRR